MKKTLSVLFAAASMAMFASCCGNAELNGKWEIVNINGKEVEAVENDPFIEFNAEEGRVHGHTSCNIMNGSFKQEGKKLTFSDMATTMMAGPDAQLEREVLDAINATASVKKDGDDKLQLLDAEGKVLMILDKEN